MQEVPDLRDCNCFRRLLILINSGVALPPFIVYPPGQGNDAGEDDGPQGLIAEHYHMEC